MLPSLSPEANTLKNLFSSLYSNGLNLMQLIHVKDPKKLHTL